MSTQQTSPEFDGKKFDRVIYDEQAMWDIPKGKHFRLGSIFYLYYEKYMFWFRVFNGYGLSAKSLKKNWFAYFSERNGHRKTYKLFGWKWEILRPSKIKCIL